MLNTSSTVIPVPVDKGGTGASTLPQNNVLIGNGSGPITSLSLTNGQFLIGRNGNAPIPSQITAGPGINIINGSGSVEVVNTDVYFDLTNVIYVVKTGDDLNNGRNINTPVQTIQHAIDLIESVSSTTGLIQILDAESYAEDLSFSGTCFIFIDGPAAEIRESSGNTITLPDTGNRYVITFNLYQINNYSGFNIFNISGALSSVFSYVQLYQSGNIYNEGGLIIKGVYLGSLSINNTATGQISFETESSIYPSITNNGLISGRIGSIGGAQYYGNCNFNDLLTVNNIPVVNNINVQTFTSDGIYTPSDNLVYAVVEIVGGGGGGGGASGALANSSSAGSGGGGGYSKGIFPASILNTPKSITIGLGGSGGAAGANNGANGGATFFDALMNATGGKFGFGSAFASSNSYGARCGTGGVGTGGFININGKQGVQGIKFNSATVCGSSTSGGSVLGTGSPSQIANNSGANGLPGSGYGSGGGGALTQNIASDFFGSNGNDGVCIITEYIQS